MERRVTMLRVRWAERTEPSAITLVGFFVKVIISKGVLTHSGQDSAPSTPAHKQNPTHSSSSSSRPRRRRSRWRTARRSEDSDDEEMVKAKEEQQLRHNQILLTSRQSVSSTSATHQPYRSLLFVPSARGNERQSQERSFHFAPLAFLAQSTTDDVRLPFLDHVLSRLQSNQLPFSFSVILCLSATIEENAEFKLRIKQQLDALVGAHGGGHRWQRANKQEKRSEQARRAAASSPVNPNLPELVLADLIYLLSYHPEFVDPTDALLPADVTRDVLDAVSAVYNYFLHILQHFLDSVMERTEGNYSLLLAICSTIKNSEDVRDPSNTKIYKLADLVQLAVHKL